MAVPSSELAQSSEEIAIRGAIARAGPVGFKNLQVRGSHHLVAVV